MNKTGSGARAYWVFDSRDDAPRWQEVPMTSGTLVRALDVLFSIENTSQVWLPQGDMKFGIEDYVAYKRQELC